MVTSTSVVLIVDGNDVTSLVVVGKTRVVVVDVVDVVVVLL